MKNLPTPDHIKWLRACSKDPSSPAQLPGSLGMLTGQDARALDAIAACWQLYSNSDDDGARGALEAVRALLPAMQAKCRPFAREAIAWAMDWNDREKLWPLVQPERPAPRSADSRFTKPIYLDATDGRPPWIIEDEYLKAHGHGLVLSPVPGCAACDRQKVSNPPARAVSFFNRCWYACEAGGYKVQRDSRYVNVFQAFNITAERINGSYPSMKTAKAACIDHARLTGCVTLPEDRT